MLHMLQPQCAGLVNATFSPVCAVHVSAFGSLRERITKWILTPDPSSELAPAPATWFLHLHVAALLDRRVVVVTFHRFSIIDSCIVVSTRRLVSPGLSWPRRSGAVRPRARWAVRHFLDFRDKVSEMNSSYWKFKLISKLTSKGQRNCVRCGQDLETLSSRFSLLKVRVPLFDSDRSRSTYSKSCVVTTDHCWFVWILTLMQICHCFVWSLQIWLHWTDANLDIQIEILHELLICRSSPHPLLPDFTPVFVSDQIPFSSSIFFALRNRFLTVDSRDVCFWHFNEQPFFSWQKWQKNRSRSKVVKTQETRSRDPHLLSASENGVKPAPSFQCFLTARTTNQCVLSALKCLLR